MRFSQRSRGVRARILPWLAPLALLSGSCSSELEKVVVVSHRGTLDVENSLGAFKAAKAQGADGVEFDVALTKDGVNVVMHDETLERTTTCSGLVRDRSLAELRAACRLQNGEPLRTLDEMLREVGPMFSVVFVELKVFDDRAREQADDVVTQVVRSGFAARVVASSYDELANRRLAERQADGIVAGWDALTEESLTNAQKFGSTWALLPFGALGPHSGDLARAAGKSLCVYVVSSRADFATAYDRGVRVMMTDSVPLLKAAATGE